MKKLLKMEKTPTKAENIWRHLVPMIIKTHQSPQKRASSASKVILPELESLRKEFPGVGTSNVAKAGRRRQPTVQQPGEFWLIRKVKGDGGGMVDGRCFSRLLHGRASLGNPALFCRTCREPR